MNIHLFTEALPSSVSPLIENNPQFRWLVYSNTETTDSDQNPKIAKGDYCFFFIAPTQNVMEHIPQHIPQLIEHSNKYPKQTIYCYVDEIDNNVFTKHQSKSLDAIGKMIEGNKAYWLKSFPNSLSDWPPVLAAASTQG